MWNGIGRNGARRTLTAMSDGAPSTTLPSTVPPEVIAAARRCFARYGVDRVTMDDIAKEAGIGRTGLYRLGLNRSQLTEAAIMARFAEIADELRPLMERNLPFAQLIVQGSVAIIDRARTDAELRHLLATTKAVELTRLLVGPNTFMHDLALSVLRPAFQRARAAGEMRDDLTDDGATDWIRGVYLMFILREDLTPEAERDMIQNYLLPSLATPDVVREASKPRAKRARTASRA